MGETRPKLGLALSGAAARSAFYIGFLEVLKEHAIPVDVIAAQSGASLVAAGYACDTLDVLKKDMLTADWSKIRPLLRRSRDKGGLYSLAPAEEHIRHFYTKSLRFEELQTTLRFVATNLETGESVPLALGDLAHAIRVTCTVPGLFTPVRWGNQYLIDGGLASFMPSAIARDAGATVVVGVSVRATRHIFLPSHIKARRFVNTVKAKVAESSLIRSLSQTSRVFSTSINEIYANQIDLPEDPYQFRKSVLSVINRSLEVAAEASKQTDIEQPNFGCDLFITEGVGNFGDSVAISKMEQLYHSGRHAAEQNIPAIKRLLYNDTTN